MALAGICSRRDASLAHFKMSLLSTAAEAEAAIADDTSASTTEFGEPLATSVRVMPVVAMGKGSLVSGV